MSENMKLGIAILITYLATVTPFIVGYAVLFADSPLAFAIGTTITLLGGALMFGWAFAILTTGGESK